MQSQHPYPVRIDDSPLSLRLKEMAAVLKEIDPRQLRTDKRALEAIGQVDAEVQRLSAYLKMPKRRVAA